MKQHSDEWILAGLRSSDQVETDRALKILYTSHYTTIAGFIEKNSGSQEDARDIFQDALIVFYEKVRLKQLDLNCSIQTYLYSICRNLWLNQLRSRKRTVPIEEDLEAVFIEPEMLSVLVTNERNDLIMRLMEQLGIDCQTILRYYYYERLRMKEIAQQMGLANEQGAKNKKARCMKRLKSLINGAPDLQNLLK